MAFAAAKSNIFGVIVMVCIILNTFVLSMDRYPEASEEEQDVLAYFNMFFNVVFTAEVIIKLIGLGMVDYLKSVENVFDFLVVAMSWAEMGMGSEGGSSFGALRAVRLFRVFKLFKSGDLLILIQSIVFTIRNIGPYIVLLCLFLYVFALMGMQFFAGQFKFADDGLGPPDYENGTIPRANFDSLGSAMLTTFACFIGDNWTYVMYDATRTVGSIYAVYFVLVIAFGNIVMLNLFLAILLGNFDKARDFGGKKKLLHAFIDLRDEGYDLSQRIDWILEDQADYIKFRLLWWNRKIVELEKEDQNAFVRHMLAERADFMEKMDLEFGKSVEKDKSEDEEDESGVTDSMSSHSRRNQRAKN